MGLTHEKGEGNGVCPVMFTLTHSPHTLCTTRIADALPPNPTPTPACAGEGCVKRQILCVVRWRRWCECSGGGYDSQSHDKCSRGGASRIHPCKRRTHVKNATQTFHLIFWLQGSIESLEFHTLA